jgi:hypothetical protein
MPKLFSTNKLLFGLSPPNRFVYLVVSLFSVLLFGGIVFGWSEIQSSFEREGYFANQCSNSSLDADINNMDKITNKPAQSPRAAYLQHYIPCTNLNSQFGEIFFMGCIAATLVPVLIGPIQDRFSNMWARVFAAAMVSSGLLCIALSSKENIGLVKLGTALLGAGGNGFQLTSFPMAVLFPNREGLVSSLCTGFFSLSSLVFLAVRLLQNRYEFTLSACLLLYTYLSVVFLALSFVWPHDFSKCDEVFAVPAVAQDEIGSSMRISARQSIRRFRTRSQQSSSAVSEGRRSWASSSQPFDSVIIESNDRHSTAVINPGSATHAKPARPTWHGTSSPSSITGDHIVAEPSSEPSIARVSAPVDCTPTCAPLEDDKVHHEENIVDENNLISENEEISKILRLTYLSGAQQLRSRQYIALVANFLISSLVSDFYIGSYLSQTRRLPARCDAGSTLAYCDSQKLAVFQIAWSAIYPCGALASPLFGLAMDRLPFRHVFVVVVLVGISHQVTNLIPVINLQFVTYVIFACGRQVIFGFFYSALGILFGFEHYGLLTSASAVFVASFIYLNKLLVDVSEKADSYFTVNIIFLALTVCLLPLKYAFVWKEPKLGLNGASEKLLSS